MLSSHELVVIFFGTSCTLFATSVGFAVAWVRARERALRAETVMRPVAPGATETDRLERAVDAIALEVERISEGQRFVTRLLAEGAGQTRQANRVEVPRMITPH
jgi:hypothetical protein